MQQQEDKPVSLVEARQRLDEALPVLALLRIFGPMLAREGLRWGSPMLRRTLPRMVANFIKQNPEQAARVGLNNPATQKALLRLSMQSGRKLQKMIDSGAVDDPKLWDRLAASARQFNKAKQPDYLERDDLHAMLRLHGFSEKQAERFIDNLEQLDYFHQSKSEDLQRLIKSITKSPERYRDFADTLN